MDTQERLTHIDNERMPVVMIPEDVALFLRKSVSWVYKHWRELSGVKIGGSIIFPDKETLYEHLFRRKEGVEVRLHQEGAAVHRPVVPNQKGRKSSRGKSVSRQCRLLTILIRLSQWLIRRHKIIFG
jgi:hypothetical protein